MEWDAYAEGWGNLPDEIKQDFETAKARVIATCGTVDGELHEGGLDCNACTRAIEKATGESCYSKDPWDAEKVKRLLAGSTWPISQDPDQWAIFSACAFMTTCAKHNLGIYFDF